MIPEEKVVIPSDWPIDEKNFSFNHMCQLGEVVSTCTTYIKDIRDKVGQKITCGQCGRQFDVVKEGEEGKKEEVK